MDVPAVRRALLRWYDAHARDLPWRRTRDPYAVWVSEAMLQQTRVETALGYHARWMARFPTVEALAAADAHDVLALWSGLGYYARARNLHAAAREVVARHGGRLPRSAEALGELPGFGPYTAAAVASIAFGEPVAAVDGNAVRVVARLAGIREAVDRAPVRRRIEAQAQALLAPRRAGDWNQAVMDLGATVCRPRQPRCPDCPLRAACASAGNAEGIPRKRPKRAARTERLRLGLLVSDARVLLVRNPERGLFGGLWRLPGGPAGGPLAEAVRRETGLRVRAGGVLARLRHELTHRTLDIEVVRLTGPVGGPIAAGAAWVPVAGLGDWPLPTAIRRSIAAASTNRRAGL